MNWPAGRKGRVFAATYVVAFAAMVAGITWTLYNQATDASTPRFIAGACLFLAGQLPIVLLAITLTTQAPPTQGKTHPDAYPLRWNRLTLGRELPAATRVLRGS
ncbi:hypothetical protein GCM10009554_23450 [Kribbella koreensis]|uniref:Uncharacterized protein n=1 Tax=Kribbella koreensis TaxID=57909 RepID=A0ABP4AK56_9ACTN